MGSRVLTRSFLRDDGGGQSRHSSRATVFLYTGVVSAPRLPAVHRIRLFQGASSSTVHSAVGTASSRSSGIALPLSIERPYVPAATRASAARRPRAVRVGRRSDPRRTRPGTARTPGSLGSSSSAGSLLSCCSRSISARSIRVRSAASSSRARSGSIKSRYPRGERSPRAWPSGGSAQISAAAGATKCAADALGRSLSARRSGWGSSSVGQRGGRLVASCAG